MNGREPLRLYKKSLWTASIKQNSTKISEVLGKEGADTGTREARVFTGGVCQDSISKHHVAQPVTDAGETTTGQGTVF